MLIKMKCEKILLFTMCFLGSMNLAIAKKYLEATIVKNNGKEVSGFVHEDLLNYGKKCLFKKSLNAKAIDYSADLIKAVKFRKHYVETQKFKRHIPNAGFRYETLFLIKIVDGEVDLFESGIAYKEKGHYISIKGRLIHIHHLYDKMPVARNRIFKRNKTTLGILFEDCDEAVEIIENVKRRYSRKILINIIFAYNKCKGADQVILRS